jgi:hypothetical protein
MFLSRVQEVDFGYSQLQELKTYSPLVFRKLVSAAFREQD